MSIDSVDTTYREQITNEGRVLGMIDSLLVPIGWKPPKGGHILDAGAYTGATSADLVNHYWDLDVQVTACDLNIWSENDGYVCPSLIRIIEREELKSGRRLSGRLNVFEANYTTNIPLPDESVDAALLLNNFSYETYYHPRILEDVNAIKQRLQEVSRTLKTGGIIVVWTDYMYANSFIIQKVADRYRVVMDYEEQSRFVTLSPWRLTSDEHRKRVIEDIDAAQKVANALSI